MRILEYQKTKYHAYIFDLINDFIFYFGEFKIKIQMLAALILLSLIFTKMHSFCLKQNSIKILTFGM